LYPSPNIIRMIKLRKVKLEGHVARMVEIINEWKIFVENLELRHRMEFLGVG